MQKDLNSRIELAARLAQVCEALALNFMNGTDLALQKFEEMPAAKEIVTAMKNNVVANIVANALYFWGIDRDQLDESIEECLSAYKAKSECKKCNESEAPNGGS